MGEITPAMRDRYGNHTKLIPADVLARIDEDEVLDRLDDAADLYAKCDQASVDLAAGYRDRARALCAAQPRDTTDAQVQVWLNKADDAATPAHRGSCLDEAAALGRENPRAERRTRPGAEERRRAQAIAQLQADVAKAAAAERAAQLAADKALLAKADMSPDAPVTRAELAPMVRLAVAEVLDAKRRQDAGRMGRAA